MNRFMPPVPNALTTVPPLSMDSSVMAKCIALGMVLALIQKQVFRLQANFVFTYSILYNNQINCFVLPFVGDIEEFPALNPVPVYPVRIDTKTDEVKVRISSKTHVGGQVLKPLCKAKEKNTDTVIIIGSGNS